MRPRYFMGLGPSGCAARCVAALSVFAVSVASASAGDGFLDIHHADGSLAKTVPLGGTYEVMVSVRARASAEFNAALFLLYSNREGVVITDYQWTPPFVTGGIGDFSLGGAPLPLVVMNGTHVAVGAPPNLADVEFGVFDLLDAAGVGDLLRITLRAPADAAEGSSYFMATLPDLFTLGFEELPLDPGTVIRVDIGPPPAPEDLNGDGQVDADDLSILLSQWGEAGSADISGNGLVGAEDLAFLLGGWSEAAN